MIGYWQKISLDEYFDNLKDYYTNCEKSSFRLSNKVQELTQEEKNYVNSNVNLEGITGFGKEQLLNLLLRLPDKYNFARHLILSDNIELKVNSILDGKSTFIYILDLIKTNTDDVYSVQHMLLELYKRGYQSKECDGTFLKEIYKELPSNDAFELWCTARFAYILNDHKKFEKVCRNEKVLFTILSFKQKKPVGINYPNLLGIANNAIQHYRDNGDILVKAMHYYGVYKEIIERDKKRVFQEKKADFEKYKPIQDKEFLEIILTVFPELV